jgi:hypothetical protein
MTPRLFWRPRSDPLCLSLMPLLIWFHLQMFRSNWCQDKCTITMWCICEKTHFLLTHWMCKSDSTFQNFFENSESLTVFSFQWYRTKFGLLCQSPFLFQSLSTAAVEVMLLWNYLVGVVLSSLCHKEIVVAVQHFLNPQHL